MHPRKRATGIQRTINGAQAAQSIVRDNDPDVDAAGPLVLEVRTRFTPSPNTNTIIIGTLRYGNPKRGLSRSVFLGAARAGDPEMVKSTKITISTVMLELDAVVADVATGKQIAATDADRGAATAEIIATMTPGADAQDDDEGVWIRGAFTASATGTILGAGARLLRLQGYNTGSASTARYLMLFDAASAPVNGDDPELAFPIQSGAGTSYSLDVAWRDDLVFGQGIQWAISTTPDTLTLDVTEGIGNRVDAQIKAP